MNDSQSLPIGLQFTVAIASIFSAAAVIIYVIQTILSVRNFNKQFKISEEQSRLSKDQFGLSQKQFHYSNQGWLSIDLHPTLAMPQTSPQKLYSSMQAGLKYQQIGLNTILENTGNTPIQVDFNSFILYFNGVAKYKYPDSVDMLDRYPPIVIYPKQKIPHSYSGIYFDSKKSSLTATEINNLAVTAKFEIEYKDLNHLGIKKINRSVKFVLTEVSIAVIYTQIHDSVPT